MAKKVVKEQYSKLVLWGITVQWFCAIFVGLQVINPKREEYIFKSILFGILVGTIFYLAFLQKRQIAFSKMQLLFCFLPWLASIEHIMPIANSSIYLFCLIAYFTLFFAIFIYPVSDKFKKCNFALYMLVILVFFIGAVNLKFNFSFDSYSYL